MDTNVPVAVLLYLPSKTNLSTMRLLGWHLGAYDEVMDWKSAPEDWYPPRGWEQVERTIYGLARGSKIALCTDSDRVREKWLAHGVDGVVLPPAVDDEFRSAEWGPISPSGPVGYFGTVHPGVIDVDYLARLARSTSVEVIGAVPDDIEVTLVEAGIRVIPQQRLPELVRQIRAWRAVVLPYRPSARAGTLVPAKVWNAVATSRPVFARNVSVPAELLDLVLWLPADPSDFVVPKVGTVASTLPTWTDRWARVVKAMESTRCVD